MFAFLAVYVLSLHVTLAEVGLIMTVGALAMTALQVPFGTLADRYSNVSLMILGTAACAVAIALIPLARDFASLLLLKTLVGVSDAVGFPPSMALATQVGRDRAWAPSWATWTAPEALGWSWVH